MKSCLRLIVAVLFIWISLVILAACSNSLVSNESKPTISSKPPEVSLSQSPNTSVIPSLNNSTPSTGISQSPSSSNPSPTVNNSPPTSNSQPSTTGSVNSGNVKQITIKAQFNSDLVLIPLSEVDKYINTRFLVNTSTDALTFMAYKYNNQLYVRAAICPPCGSESFTLTKGTLVCDSCGTVFDAQTGRGIKGACVKFSKQPVPYESKDGSIVMKAADLATAFQNTVNPKR